MTDKKTEALKLAQEALDVLLTEPIAHKAADRAEYLLLQAAPAIREALAEQPAQQQEPDAMGLIVSGAIFDFAGYLTTRDKVIEVGSTANASPVADLVKEWAALRGLSLEDAAVLSWQEWLTPVSTSDTLQERVDEMQKQRHEQPAQQQEPVVWMYVNKSTHKTKFQKHMSDFVDHSLWSEVPLYGEP